MVRDRSSAGRATRRLAALSVAACVALAGCGIKGPLKRVDPAAPPPAAAAAPPSDATAEPGKPRLP
ncbi:MAG TPA: lipoprotein [Casimicrobiaceae bacterium]|nr:lipoprotein [Casimicrobiaceae bacterium]